MTISSIAQITLQGDSSFSVPSVEGCSQVFAECSGIGCERDCGARPITPVYDLTENTRPLSPWDLAFIAFTVVSLLVVFLMPVAADRFNAVQIAMEDQ